jgi:hypothetical protein
MIDKIDQAKVLKSLAKLSKLSREVANSLREDESIKEFYGKDLELIDLLCDNADELLKKFGYEA